MGKHLLSALLQRFGEDNVLALTSKPLADCNYVLHGNYSFNKDFFLKNGFAERVQTIIHAGAFTPKNSGQANDWVNCNQNIQATDALLRASLPNVEKFIYISTLDVYGADKIVSEGTAIFPFSLYGHSKYYSERMVEAWSRANAKLHQVLRLGHVYGPGEEAYEKIIPLSIRNILTGYPVKVFGNGDDVRSFIYIDDVVTAILNSLDLTVHVGPVNVASSQKISMRVLLEKLAALSNKTLRLEFIPNYIRRDVVFDNSKLRQLLLSSETPLDEGLKAELNYMNEVVAL